jgi:hypothetical protein
MLTAGIEGVGGTDIVFLASPKEAIKVLVHTYGAVPVIATGGLADGVLMAVPPRALAVIADRGPVRIETSDAAAVH